MTRHTMSPERKEKLKAIAEAKDTEKLKEFITEEQKIKEAEEKDKEVAESIKIGKDIADLNAMPDITPKPTPTGIRQLKEPKIKIKEAPKPAKASSKVMMRPNPEQIHTLVHTVVIGATTLMNKEEVTKEEDKAFSEVLYDVGDSLGWFDSIDFLPYLILLFSAIDLSITIVKKPSKTKQRQIQAQPPIVQKLEHEPDNKSADPKFDVVDEAALMTKLGGNAIYATSGEATE